MNLSCKMMDYEHDICVVYQSLLSVLNRWNSGFILVFIHEAFMG